MNVATRNFPGSARGSRAGDRAFAIANFRGSIIDHKTAPIAETVCRLIQKRTAFRRGRRNQHASRVRSPESEQLIGINIDGHDYVFGKGQLFESFADESA